MRNKEEAFRELWRNAHGVFKEEEQTVDLKYKGKVLNGLKEYPRLNLQRAFWKWYLNTTATGLGHFQRAADNLVLYTNCNKTTAFYRLLHKVRENVVHISLATKRKIQMLATTLKLTMEKYKREAYNMVKMASKSVKQKGVKKIIESSKAKQKNCLNLWLRNTKLMNDFFSEQAKIR